MQRGQSQALFRGEVLQSDEDLAAPVQGLLKSNEIQETPVTIEVFRGSVPDFFLPFFVLPVQQIMYYSASRNVVLWELFQFTSRFAGLYILKHFQRLF